MSQSFSIAHKTLPSPLSSSQSPAGGGAAEFPHCILPENFFERALNAARKERKLLLSIDRWDGRSVYSIER